MEVSVVECAAFGLTVSEAKTEIMCLRAKGMPESTATFNVEAAGQVYSQTNEFVYLGGNVNHNADLSVEVDRRIHTQCMVQLPEVHPRTVRPTERSPRAQNPHAKSRGTQDDAVRLRHMEPARVPLRHAAPSPPQVLDSLHRLVKAQSIAPTTRFPIWTRLSGREVRASRRLYAEGGSCLRDLWRAWRIRDCRSA